MTVYIVGLKHPKFKCSCPVSASVYRDVKPTHDISE
jgi:hypothetical protein